MNRYVVSAALVGVLSVGAVACGSSTSTSAPTASTQAASMSTATGTVTGTSNAADITFAQSMVPHHQQAVAMAKLALDAKSGASTAVKDLATRIQAAQGPEITMMQGWLPMWGAGMEMDGMHDTTAMGATAGTSTDGSTAMAMPGMMSDADMTALGAATGKAFDTMWLTMMTAHHQGAITMSKTEQQTGMSADAKALAGQIITAQQAEIAEMQKLMTAG